MRLRTVLAAPAHPGHVLVLKAGRLDAVDEDAPHSHLSDNLVEW